MSVPGAYASSDSEDVEDNYASLLAAENLIDELDDSADFMDESMDDDDEDDIFAGDDPDIEDEDDETPLDADDAGEAQGGMGGPVRVMFDRKFGALETWSSRQADSGRGRGGGCSFG